MKPQFALCRSALVLLTITAWTACESTKSASVTQSQSQNQDQPAAPVGNPVAAYNVVSKELQRDPENERLQQAQQRYGTRTVDQLLAERAYVPETNLSVHERILVEAQKYESERSAEVTAELAGLRAKRQEILAAFESNANSGLTAAEALAKCAPFADYAHTDVDIREALVNSPFVTELQEEMRKDAAAGRFGSTRTLQQAVAEAGYEELLRRRLNAAEQEGARDYVRQQLDQRFGTTTALPGERAVWATLLGEPAPRLKLDLVITGAEDPEVPAQITENVSNRLGSVFAIDPLDLARMPAEPDGDVFLVVDVAKTDVATSERVEDRPSEYIKSYEEVPNPEYERAFEEWSIARMELDILEDRYEQDLEIYEADKAILEGPSLVESAILMMVGEDPTAAPEPATEQDAPSARGYVPPPLPPDTTRHALATRRLQSTPRKIRQPAFQEYHYVARVVEARFSAAANLGVFDRLSAASETEEDVTYEHARSWIQTSGVHVRDANRTMGDFTTDSIDFEKEVFLGGFADTCIEKSRELLSAKALELLTTAVTQQRSAALTFGLALFAAAQDATQLELSTAEVVELAETLSRTDADSGAWRVAGLAHIIRAGKLESTVPLDTAARLMSSSPARTVPTEPSPGERLRQHLDS